MRKNTKRNLICIVGPTATGKTGLSVELAKAYNCEIVSADSMQVYKNMDIGTAKPDMNERQGIFHHMMDVVPAFENYSVARYTRDATDAIEKIYKNNATPLLVGGTGLYIDSVIRGMEFAEFNQDTEYRESLYETARCEGVDVVYNLLCDVDPGIAERLHKNDIKRVIRALEVYKTTGKTLSEHNKKTAEYEERYNVLYLGLNYEDRQELYKRIDERVDLMMERGLLDEVKRLVNDGVPLYSTSLQAIGYKELVEAIENKVSIDSAVSLIKQNSRRYAKRQLTWFRKNQKINWIYVDNKKVCDILQASTIFIKDFGIM